MDKLTSEISSKAMRTLSTMNDSKLATEICAFLEYQHMHEHAMRHLPMNFKYKYGNHSDNGWCQTVQPLFHYDAVDDSNTQGQGGVLQ